jgi:hypothetical protein
VKARKVVKIALLSLLGLLVAIQLVPYGRDHSNPPVTAEPAWDSPQTRRLVAASCFDCHSNQTSWPWYTSVAPFSWLTQRDVDDGRATLNFSEWNRPQEIDEIIGIISEGEMPPWYYGLLHSSARLSDQERQQLIDGLRATLQVSPPAAG